MTTPDNRLQDQPLSLSDLTATSLSAAVQLDRILSGQVADEAPIRKLSDTLRNASEIPRSDGTSFLHCNPTTLGVLSRVLGEAGTGQPGTVDELAREIYAYVDLFSKDASAWTKDAINRSLAFCVSLHRELISEISRPDNPFNSNDAISRVSWI